MSAYQDLDPAEVGAALLGWLAATRGMRHASPRGGLDYIAVDEGSAEALVRDFVASTTGYPALVPGCRDRLDDLGTRLLRDAYAARFGEDSSHFGIPTTALLGDDAAAGAA